MLVKKKKNDEDILNTLNSFTSGLNDTNIKSLEERTSPTTKTYNANELKNLLNNAESSRKSAVSNFNKYLGNNNVISNNQNPLLTPTAKELRDSKDLIKSPVNTRNALTDELQNQQNYRNAIKTDEAKSLLNDVNEKKVASGLLRGKYNLEAAKEDVANDSNFDTLLKTLSSPLRGIATMFGHDGALTYNEKGEIVKGKSILQAQSDEMAKLGGATGFVNQMGDQLGKQSVQMLLNSLIPGTGNAAYFSTLANDVYDETKREGYNDKQAYLYTALNTASEYFVGKALGSTIGKYSKSNATEKTISNILKPLIKNAEVNKTLSTMTAEGLEEFVQEYVDVVARNVSLGEDNKVDFDTFKNALYSFGLGAASSGVMSAVDTSLKTKSQKNTEQEAYDISRKMNKNFDESTNARIIDTINHQKEKGNYSQENLINQLSKENQVIDELVKNKIGDKKVNKKEESKIREEIVNNLEKGYTDLDDIVNILGGKDLKDYNDYNDLLNKYNEINGKTKKSSLDNEELSRLYENISKYDFDKLKTNLSDKINIDEDSLLYNSVRENDNKKVAYKNDLNLYNKNQQKVIKNAIDSGILNNSRKTHDFVDMIAKISSDKNVTFDFTNNKKLQESGFALKDKQVNGFINNDKITINIESKNALNSVVGHEVTHVLEGSKLYAELQQAVKEYATTKGDYESRLAETTELYKNIKGANIENELTSDLIGEYIFTDTDFVNSLSTTKPNIFQKIYNEIKYIYKLAIAGSKEARQLEKVKKTFEDAYKENIKVKKSGINFSLSENALQEVSDVVNQTREDSEKSSIQFVKLKDNTIKSLIDYGVKDLPMLERSGHIRENILTEEQAKKLGFSTKNKHFHGLGVKTYLEIINSMDNPIGVYQYTNNGKYDNNNFIVVTPVEINGTNYIVPVEINQRGQYNQVEVDYNKIKTAYSKNNTDYIQSLLNQGKIKEIFNGSNSRKTSLNESNIPQFNKTVKSDISTKYSMQENTNNTQELDNSSFSLNKNAKQYDESPKNSNLTYSDDVKINTDNKSLKNEIENADKSVKKINIKDIKNLSNVKNKEEKNLSPVKGEQSAKILSKTPIDTSKGSIKRGINIFRAAILDKGSVFEDLAIKSKNRQLMATWDSTMTSQAKAQNIIGDGYQKFNSETKSIEKLSKSLYEIQNEVVNSGNIEDFSNYIYHKHNIDRMNLKSKAETELSTFENNNHDLMFKNKNSQRSYDEILELSKLKKATNEKEENLISAAKEYVKLKEKYDKTENKPVFGNDVTAEISQELVNEYENAHPEFIDYASDIYDYLKAQKQTLVDNGIISQETSDLWNEMYPHYVPISRVNENNLKIDVPLKRTGTNNPVKAATGGNSDILPLFDTLADRTFQTQKAIDKNKFGIELMNSLDTTTEFNSIDVDGLINDIDNQENLLNKGTKEKLPTFTVFKNGERITYAINQDMYDALSPISNIPLLNTNSKTLNKLSSFQRGVLTEYNPVFMITNAVKDAQDVLINSQHAAKTYSKFLEAQKQIKNKGYYYQEYMANGGEQNTYFDYKTKVFDTQESSKLNKIFKMPLEKISEANDFIEMTPRLAEYIASRESGRSVEVSMLDAARVTTNFKAGGDVTKWVNRNGGTFLNASVQGFNQQIRNFREANANGIRGYAGLALKFAVASLPVIALNDLVWKDDDDYKEELSDYVKQNYYVVFRYGKGKYIRIPKGRTLSVIQNFVEQTENVVKKTGEFDVNEFISMAIDNLAPNDPLKNNVISPLVQAASNKTWYKTDLVPTRLQNKPAAEQYDESIDEISKWLGKTFNVSPYKINYIMNQYSGGIGDVIMPMLTPETKSGNNTLLEYALSPLVDKFTADSVMNNKNTGNLYEISEKLTINANKSNATNEDILKNKFVNSMKSEMNDLYKEKREIQNSNISKKEKYEKVRSVQNQINEMSKYALNNYSDVKIEGNYATIGTKEYRLKTDSDGAESWTKITDDQKTKQRNVSSALGITASEYWSNKTEYDYAYDNPGKYATITSITDYDTYTTYSKEISNIKSDKDSKGNSITDSRKKKVFAYINNLDLEFEQKVILAKMQYPSYNQYNNEILNYLNKNNDINYNEKILILKQLGFTVGENGKVRW